MINFDIPTNKNKKEHNSKLPYITDDPFRILVIASGYEKVNALLNLMNIHLNTLLDIVIMVLLDHYFIYFTNDWLY